jgi:uncharacterized protein
MTDASEQETGLRGPDRVGSGRIVAPQGGDPGGVSPARTILLAGEFFLLYVVAPTVAALFARSFPALLLPVLAVSGLVLAVLLWRDPTFARRRLWGAGEMRAWWWRILLLVGGFAIVVLGAVILWVPESLFYLPRHKPALWAAIMVGYPLASVYPQEIIFRTWLFHRYRSLLPGKWTRITASAAAFGYAHLMFQNPLALILTGLGGFVFARTYERSRSTFVVAAEHALYGAVIFTVGLGEYFYLGSVGR